MSEPNNRGPSTFDPGRPASSRRPRTAARRAPPTARPDTGASGIGELPDQQFFPEGEEFEEEEEEEEDEEPEQSGVFAFARPVTAAPPSVFSGYATSDYGTTAPNTAPHPTTAGTAVSGAAFGIGAPSTPDTRSVSTPTGQMDAGGHVPTLEYDPTHPPPMSGRANMNNSSFAFMNKLNNRPGTGSSLLDKLHRRNVNTASTAVTGTTEFSVTTETLDDMSGNSRDDTDAVSFKTESDASKPMQITRRMRSTAPLISGSNASEVTSEAGTRRGRSRGSYGMTELTGDITVPGGKTTWGDGLGGMMKSDGEGGSLVGIDIDLAEEDSPYPEVRASVSNLDDPEMPGGFRPTRLC